MITQNSSKAELWNEVISLREDLNTLNFQVLGLSNKLNMQSAGIGEYKDPFKNAVAASQTPAEGQYVPPKKEKWGKYKDSSDVVLRHGYTIMIENIHENEIQEMKQALFPHEDTHTENTTGELSTEPAE